jgi:hydroxymethylpyrimidine pyrophosphatase-like HAD family hydrolase
MRYACLTCDFDGTIARDGTVSPNTLEALTKVRRSGRKLVLATGRELDDLFRVFPDAGLFDRIVGENGAVLYRTASKERIRLAEPPPPRFAEELRSRGIHPLSIGECVVSTWHPHEKAVLETIRDLNLELQIIFNKGAVMVLPSGVNKGTGLEIALRELGLSAHNVVGIGDAENDHGFLTICECSVAVGNALSAIRERADWVTAGTHGDGVDELIQILLKNDLEDLAPRLKRHDILLGSLGNGEPCTISVYGSRLLIAGPSGGGKSTTVSAIVERLVNAKYQVCLFDPEGDYDEFKPLVSLGGPNRIPATTEVLDTLANPTQSVCVNLLGVPLVDRPSYFRSLLTHVQELRAQKARPHWIVVDEAHHLLPTESPASNVPKDLNSLALVTVHPDSVSPHMLKTVTGIIVVGKKPQTVIDQFLKGVGANTFDHQAKLPPPETGQILIWFLSQPAGPAYATIQMADSQLRRHRRKYAVGELGEDKSFYFRGPDAKLNLRAQNLNLFVQLAEGVDDETWMFHLFRGDYSRWLQEKVKDKDLASVVESIERQSSVEPAKSRQQVIEAIRKQYTAPT